MSVPGSPPGHLGLLGHSAEGAALCFRTFCSTAAARLGGYEHPDVTLDCISMARSMPAWDAGDHDAVRAILAESVERLARAGATFFACPDNTAHLALERPGPDLALPGLHIAAVVADQAHREGRRRVGVLGTRWTMGSTLYPSALAARGIAAEVPGAEDQDAVHRIIFDELVHGVVARESADRYGAVIRRLRDRGCDAVALVCTEIPLLVTPDSSSLPVLDSTRLLATAALDVCLGDRTVPIWRGGPLVVADRFRDRIGVE